MATFHLQGRAKAPQEYTVAVPALFIDRESLVISYQRAIERTGEPMSLVRAAGALIGRCSSLGRAAKADWSACGCDPRVYGGEVYSFLREQGCTVQEIGAAGKVCYDECLATLTSRPSMEVIERRAGESTPPAPGVTG